jgi:hypothetical protein
MAVRLPARRAAVRRERRGPLLILLASLATASSAPGMPAQDGALCGDCKTTGRVANPYHAPHAAAEKGSRYCSVCLEGDRAGRDAEFLPCPRCKRPDLKRAAEAELATWKEERERWLAGCAALEQQVGTKLHWVESDHFLVGFEPDHWKTRDKRELDGHAAAHLFARRLEGMYADFEKLFGIAEERMRNQRHQVLIFEKQKTLSHAAQQLLQMTSGTAAKRAGDPSILLTWVDRKSLPGDLEMDRHVTHHVTHLLVSVFHRKEWLYAQGFLDEGLSHYFEMRYFGSADNSCNQEAEEESFGNANWPRDVLAAVQSGRTPPFAELAAKRTDQLQGSDHSFAWSFADFLVARDPARVADLMVRLKEKTELREALRGAFGRSFFELEGDWKAWVLANYPARAKPPPPGVERKIAADELRGWPDR